MNILHMIETGGPGGAENVLINLAYNLNKNNNKSIVLLCKPGWLYEELKKLGIETFIVGESGVFDLNYLFNLINIIRKYKISVIHSHEFLMSLYATIVGIILCIPVVTTIHGKYNYWEKFRRKIAMKFIVKYSQMVSVSNELRYFISDKVGVNANDIITIYNGIDISKYSELGGDLNLKHNLGIPDEFKVIITVGNLYKVKGHIYLIRAIPEILNNYKNVVFILAGRGEEENMLREEAILLNIDKHIMFLGYRRDIPELLSISDIFVLPSLAESLPLSILESLAMGVPVVATNVGGNSEIINDAENGFIVPASDSKSLYEKIVVLLSDNDLSNRFRCVSRSTIINKFTLNSMMFQYDLLYQKMTLKHKFTGKIHI